MKAKFIYLPAPQIECLLGLAKTKDVSFSELVRRAIDLYLDEQPKEKSLVEKEQRAE